MSLINDALRDLEERRPPSKPFTSAAVSQERGEDVVTQHSSTSKTKFFVAGATITAVCLSAYWAGLSSGERGPVVQNQPQSLTAKPSQNLPQTLAQNTVPSSLPPTEAVVDVVKQASALPVKDDASGDVQLDHVQNQYAANTKTSRVDELTVLVEAAIKKNRLSVPVSANALYYLGEILKIDANNAYAQAKKVDVKNIFVAQLEASLQKKNDERFNTLISRASIFGLSELEQQGLRERFDKQKIVIALANTRDVPKLEVKAVDKQANRAVQVNTSEEQDRAWVKEAALSKAKKELDGIRAGLNMNGNVDSVSQLTSFIGKYPELVEAQILLFDYALRIDDLAQAQALAGGADAGNFARNYMNAKLAHRFHGVEKAIVILESNAIDPRIYEQQGAYLAALYHKVKRYSDAKRVFMKLVKIDNGNPQYVLGFALATDALGERHEAFQAYTKLLRVGHPQESVIRFAEQRAQILKPNMSSENSADSLAEANQW